MRTLIAFLLALMAGGYTMYDVTDGFRTVTTEDARRLAVASHPRSLPDVRLEDTSGVRLPLARMLRTDGRITIVTFIYTRCTTICSAVGTEFQQLQATIQSRGLDRQIRLLSISFDPEDTPARLSAYAGRMHAAAGLWQVAGVADTAQRQALLQAFGIVVIPAPLGEFQHNAAFHIVTADGKLARIVDYDAPDTALAVALDLARPKAPAMRTAAL